ncbi:MAG: YfhO family protein [Actinomycetota bacterium]|nr:YfhO family protein [Actinomycetota bacterium]
MRRSWSGFDRLLALGLLVFVAVGLGPSLLGRDLAVDTNLLTQFQPWRAQTGADVSATNTCRSDTVDHFLPAIAEVKRDLGGGTYPTWSQSSVGGVPLTSPNTAHFSPLALPYYVMPLWLAPAFVKLLQVLVVTAGMMAFLRRLGVGRAGGLLGSLVYASSAFMIMWSNWPQTQTAAFVPALFWATERLVQEARARDAVPLALVLASMLLGGFPQVTGLALYVAGAYFVARVLALHRRSWRGVVRRTAVAVGGLVVGGLLSAVQMLPFARQIAETDLSYRSSTKGAHSPLYTLLTVLSPHILGTCVGGDGRGPTPVEAAAFVGVGAIVLALVPLVWSRARGRWGQPGHLIWFFTAVTIVCVVIGWFGGPLLVALQGLPVFSNSSIWRIRVILGFSLAVLAGLGLDRVLIHLRLRGNAPPPGGGTPPGDGTPFEPETPRRADAEVVSGRGVARGRSRGPLWTLAVLLVGAAAAYAGVQALVSAREAATQGRYYLAWREPTVAAGVLLLVALLLLLVIRLAPRVLGVAAVLLIVGIVVFQATRFIAIDIGGSDPENFYPVTPTHAYLQQHLGEDRFAGSDLIALSSTAGYYGLRAPTGHQFTKPSWVDLLKAVDPLVMKTATFSDFGSAQVPVAQVGRNPILDRLAVRYWLGPDATVPGTLTAPPGTGDKIPAAPGSELTCTLPAGPLRAVVIQAADDLTGAAPPGPGAFVEVSVHTADGQVVTGARWLGKGVPNATVLPVGVPGGGLTSSDGPLTATVRLLGTTGIPVLAGTRGELACGRVTPVDDGLRLADSHRGAITWERLTSLSRVRWAGSTLVEPDSAGQVAALEQGVPADTVVLSGGTASGRPGPGGVAQLRTRSDQGGEISVDVGAEAPGHLVVADALAGSGWSASVDGATVPIVSADHAMAAVAVPAGQHVVTLRYDAPGLHQGAVLSLLGGAAVILVLVGGRRRRREGQRDESHNRVSS